MGYRDNNFVLHLGFFYIRGYSSWSRYITGTSKEPLAYGARAQGAELTKCLGHDFGYCGVVGRIGNQTKTLAVVGKRMLAAGGCWTCETKTIRTVWSCSRDGFLAVKLVTGKEERESKRSSWL